MYCSNCGKEITAGAKFCPLCGNHILNAKSISENEEMSQQLISACNHILQGKKESQKSANKLRIIAIVTIVILCMSMFGSIGYKYLFLHNTDGAQVNIQTDIEQDEAPQISEATSMDILSDTSNEQIVENELEGNVQDTINTLITENERKNQYALIKFDVYDENNTLEGGMEREYDVDGNLLGETVWGGENVEVRKTYEYRFNQDGTLSYKKQTIDSFESMDVTEYFYDEHGNLIALDGEYHQKKLSDDSNFYLGVSISVRTEWGWMYPHRTRKFVYDADGRAISFETFDQNKNIVELGKITYDYAGMFAKYNVYDGEDKIIYQGEVMYDAKHRVISAKCMDDEEILIKMNYEYDKFDHQISSITYESGFEGDLHTVNVYDDDGRLLEILSYYEDDLLGRKMATEWITFSD